MASIPGACFSEVPVRLKSKTRRRSKIKETPHNKKWTELAGDVLQKARQEKDRELHHLSGVITEKRSDNEKLKQYNDDNERKFKSELLDERERGRKHSDASLIKQQDAIRQIESLKASNERVQNELDRTLIQCTTAEKELEKIKLEQILNGRRMEVRERQAYERNKAELSQASKYTEQLRSSLEEEIRKTEEAQASLNQSQEKLRQTIDTFQKERKSMENLKDEFRKTQEQIHDNQHRIEELEQQLAIKESKLENDNVHHKMELKQLEEKLRQTRNELHKEKQTNMTYMEELKKTTDVASRSQAAAKVPIPDYQAAIDDLQQMLEIKDRMFERDKKIFNTQLKELQEENRRLVKETARDAYSHAELMDGNAENINIQNRPIKIAEEYTHLMTTFWLDAKSALDDVTTEDKSEVDMITLLFNIVLICEEEATKLYKHIIQDLRSTLQNPMHGFKAYEASGGAPSVDESDEGLELPSHVLTVIEDYFRTNAHQVDLRKLQQRVEATLQTKYAENKRHFISTSLQLDGVSRFITESVCITWKMALQRPSLLFDASQIGEPWHNDGHLELITGSEPDAENAVIQYYKGPTLLHAGNMMVKGSVFVHSHKYPK